MNVWKVTVSLGCEDREYGIVLADTEEEAMDKALKSPNRSPGEKKPIVELLELDEQDFGVVTIIIGKGG